jgi:hypothetical protein
MCNQVRGFHRGFPKFIAKNQITFPNCIQIFICVCIHILFPSQTELKVIGLPSDITIQYVQLKVILHFVRWFSDRYFKAWIIWENGMITVDDLHRILHVNFRHLWRDFSHLPKNLLQKGHCYMPSLIPMGDSSYGLNFDQGKKNEIQHQLSLRCRNTS